MKNFTQNSQIALTNLRCILGMILMIALMLPANLMAQSSPLPLNLGTSGNFVALAKTGISSTGTTAIVGDIGVSPNNAASITGFNLVADASGQFSTSSVVVGKVYAADYASPTPTILTAAVGDMETAYTEAAGRTPDFTELYTGDLTGKTLTTGVYKWGTGVLISAGGVTISGSSTDVFIFQIAQNLTVASGAIITLSGGVLPSNIFWQVAGNATLGTTSDFSGIILCKTQIDMMTGAAFKGRALAQTAVTLDGNSVRISGNSSSILDLSLGNSIKIYPNPSRNSMTISNSSGIQMNALLVYDMSGRLIKTIDLRDMEQERTIDLSNLSSGIYMLHVQSDDALATKRWVKL